MRFRSARRFAPSAVAAVALLCALTSCGGSSAPSEASSPAATADIVDCSSEFPLAIRRGDGRRVPTSRH